MCITEEQEAPVRKLETICKVCIFASRDEFGNQIGCNLNNLQKFQDRGVELEFINNDGPSYYKIPNNICWWARTSDWQHSNKTDKVNILRNELRERNKLDIIIDFDYEHSISNLNTTLNSLKNQKVKPFNVIIVTNNLSPKFIVSLVNFVKKEMDETGIKWSLERGTIEEDKNHRIMRAIRKCRKMYFAFFDAGFKIPELFLKDIDDYINDKLGMFSLILPIEEESDNGIVVQTGLYSTIGDASKFIGTVQEMAKEQNQEHMIKNPKEVFSWMK